MTVQEKTAILLVEIPWLTLELCAKLEKELRVKTLYGLLRLTWKLLAERGFDRDELFQINGAIYRLGFTFLASTDSIITGLAIIWEEHPSDTPLSKVLDSKKIIGELEEAKVTTIGDIYFRLVREDSDKVVANRQNLPNIDRTLRTYHARTVQPWIHDFQAFWEKVRVGKSNGNGSNPSEGRRPVASGK